MAEWKEKEGILPNLKSPLQLYRSYKPHSVQRFVFYGL